MQIYGFNGKMNIVGVCLKDLRESKGYTQEQVAAKMQVYNVTIGQKAISRIELGERIVTDYELLIFARVFSVRAEWLLTGEDKK